MTFREKQAIGDAVAALLSALAGHDVPVDDAAIIQTLRSEAERIRTTEIEQTREAVREMVEVLKARGPLTTTMHKLASALADPHPNEMERQAHHTMRELPFSPWRGAVEPVEGYLPNELRKATARLQAEDLSDLREGARQLLDALGENIFDGREGAEWPSNLPIRLRLAADAIRRQAQLEGLLREAFAEMRSQVNLIWKDVDGRQKEAKEGSGG